MSDFKFSQIGKAGNDLTQVGRDYVRTVQVNIQAGNWLIVAALVAPLMLSLWLGFEVIKRGTTSTPKYAQCLDGEQPIQGQVLGNTIICLGASKGRNHAFVRTLDLQNNGEKSYGISQDVSDFSGNAEGLGFNVKGFKFMQEYRNSNQEVVQSSKCLYSLQEVWRFCDENFNMEQANPTAFPTLTRNRDVVAWVRFDQFSGMKDAEYYAEEREKIRAKQEAYNNQPDRCKQEVKRSREEWEGCLDGLGIVVHFNKDGYRVDENGTKLDPDKVGSVSWNPFLR
jgi:hypothetical protein